MSSADTMRYTFGADKCSPSFRCDFLPCERQPLSWVEEIKRSAVAIAQRTTRPIWICSSGGIDSEVICEIFLELGIPFQVLTVRYAGGLNAHDIGFAKDWCDRNFVKQKIYELDIIDFIQNQITSYMQADYIAVHPTRYIQIKLLSLVEEMDGFGILGVGEQIYDIDRSKKEFTAEDPYLPINPAYVTPLEWCRRNNLEHEPDFYLSTPELVLAWLQIPLVDFTLNNPEFFRHPANAYSLKMCAIRQHFPYQKVRAKYTGYENFKPLMDKTAAMLKEHFGARGEIFNLKVSTLRRQLESAL